MGIGRYIRGLSLRLVSQKSVQIHKNGQNQCFHSFFCEKFCFNMVLICGVQKDGPFRAMKKSYHAQGVAATTSKGRMCFSYCGSH